MIVRIKSQREGFRRCGIAHSKVATDHPAERFSAAELEILQADPALTVELLDGELEASGSLTGTSDSAGAGSVSAGEPQPAPAVVAKPKVVAAKSSAKAPAKSGAKAPAKKASAAKATKEEPAPAADQAPATPADAGSEGTGA